MKLWNSKRVPCLIQRQTHVSSVYCRLKTFPVSWINNIRWVSQIMKKAKFDLFWHWHRHDSCMQADVLNLCWVQTYLRYPSLYIYIYVIHICTHTYRYMYKHTHTYTYPYTLTYITYIYLEVFFYMIFMQLCDMCIVCVGLCLFYLLYVWYTCSQYKYFDGCTQQSSVTADGCAYMNS